MTPAEQIQIAADMLDAEFQDMGLFGVSKAQCLSIARRLHDLWMKPGGEQRYIRTPGEVAQKFRERYEGAYPLLDGPLVRPPVSDIVESIELLTEIHADQ